VLAGLKWIARYFIDLNFPERILASALIDWLWGGIEESVESTAESPR